jgi:hypothetical protein
MSDRKFEETERDILIKLLTNVEQINKSMDHFQKSEARQWEKIDDHGAKIEGQERSIGFLTKGFWVVSGGVVTVGGGIAIWVVTHVPK